MGFLYQIRDRKGSYTARFAQEKAFRETVKFELHPPPGIAMFQDTVRPPAGNRTKGAKEP
jgi:hypothetical protein